MALNDVKDRVYQLENAIKRLDSVKKHLNRNASDIKSEIHASVSRNLECLRGREVSLLNQVDQVLGIKEDTLQQQQARLNQALGVLQTGLCMAHDDSASDRQLRETLDKLNRLELSPEETPYIAFRADHISLRDSILNYGRVDANGLPLICAFDDPGNPSASLPRSIEEYEDEEHHVLYKTVEDVKRAKSSASCINVNIPKLSTRVEDWLQKKVLHPCIKKGPESSPAKHLPATRPSTLIKTGSAVPQNVSASSTPGSSCSLNNWLSLIKQHADLEEEHDFEIIDNSRPRKSAQETVPVMDISKLPSDVFRHIEKDLKAWLKPGNKVAAEFSSNFFKHVPSDTKVWLIQACRQLSSLDDLKHEDVFKHISRDTATWLRSRAYPRQQAAITASQEKKVEKDFFSHISRDTQKWLASQITNVASTVNDGTGDAKTASTTSKPAQGVEKDDSKWLICSSDSSSSLKCCSTSSPNFQLEDVCRANEPCCDISRCVSQPDCVTMCFRERSPVKNSVDPTQVFKPLCLPTHQWLSPRSAKNPNTDSSPAAKKENISNMPGDIFSHIPDSGDSVWLSAPVPPSQSTSAPHSPTLFKGEKENTNLWLQKAKSSTSETEVNSEPVVFSLPMTQPDFCISDWLFVPMEKEKKEEGSEREKEESEGWSICSEALSINSDQYAKDCATATDYFNNFLI